MIQKSIDRLSYLIDKVPGILTDMDEGILSLKPFPEKWSKKEIIGHLIDSAANNHQRFVRGQFEDIPNISYDQNSWNKFSYHQEIDKNQIIAFWTIYNRQLLEIIKRISSEKLERRIKVGENELTLEYLIIDYVDHLEHHLKQIIDY
jgi:hypothetical protein